MWGPCTVGTNCTFMILLHSMTSINVWGLYSTSQFMATHNVTLNLEVFVIGCFFKDNKCLVCYRQAWKKIM